ncbi:hypothetical protein RB628_18335 [Streptomyces sp. ADMS]|uniref:hypothetical protein n=1 Tax=Streptomyces sp. ADMS TaxID=3071415 RepID=UPI00296EDA0D|nr:hypothetical protein [Streptomyces sp. ADMS]MDW4907257.1 hypothetical protein [Streptomyces sp. ADMS]
MPVVFGRGGHPCSRFANSGVRAARPSGRTNQAGGPRAHGAARRPPVGPRARQRAAHPADDEQPTARLLTALRDLADHAHALRDTSQVAAPSRAERTEQARLPRDAYSARHAKASVAQAVGRIAAGTVTEPVLEYLT